MDVTYGFLIGGFVGFICIVIFSIMDKPKLEISGVFGPFRRTLYNIDARSPLRVRHSPITYDSYTVKIRHREKWCFNRRAEGCAAWLALDSGKECRLKWANDLWQVAINPGEGVELDLCAIDVESGYLYAPAESLRSTFPVALTAQKKELDATLTVTSTRGRGNIAQLHIRPSKNEVNGEYSAEIEKRSDHSNRWFSKSAKAQDEPHRLLMMNPLSLGLTFFGISLTLLKFEQILAAQVYGYLAFGFSFLLLIAVFCGHLKRLLVDKAPWIMPSIFVIYLTALIVKLVDAMSGENGAILYLMFGLGFAWILAIFVIMFSEPLTNPKTRGFALIVPIAFFILGAINLFHHDYLAGGVPVALGILSLVLFHLKPRLGYRIP